MAGPFEFVSDNVLMSVEPSLVAPSVASSIDLAARMLNAMRQVSLPSGPIWVYKLDKCMHADVLKNKIIQWAYMYNTASRTQHVEPAIHVMHRIRRTALASNLPAVLTCQKRLCR